jgi:hypothetical protein
VKEETKTVYYCEYCGKHYLSKRWCREHEKKCTANINRVYGMCALVGIKNNIPETIETLEHNRSLVTMEGIRALTNDCPAYILTVLRALDNDERFEDFALSEYYFDYKSEAKSKFREIDETWEQRAAGGSLIYK